MPIPDYQTVMLPLLTFLNDQKEHNLGEVVGSLATTFDLSQDERQQLLGSGQQTVIGKRAGWVKDALAGIWLFRTGCPSRRLQGQDGPVLPEISGGGGDRD